MADEKQDSPIKTGLKIAVGIDAEAGLIVVEFEHALKWFAFSGEEAKNFAGLLVEKALLVEQAKNVEGAQAVAEKENKDRSDSV